MKEQIDRCFFGVLWPPAMRTLVWPHEPREVYAGSTEPWVCQLLASMLLAHGGRDVLELGVSAGYTSVWLVETLQRMGGGTFRGYDSNRALLNQAQALLDTLEAPKVEVTLETGISPACIESLPDKSVDFAWIDDEHTISHIDRELAALQRVMRKRGIICGHDVFGCFNLVPAFQKVGGFCLDTQRRVGSWGIGIWQRRS